MQKAILLFDQKFDWNGGLGFAHGKEQNPKRDEEEQLKNLYSSITSKTEACSNI